MKLIAAVDKNWAIGYKDKLLVHIPEDMKRFREITMGKVVVLGRKTLAGFPNGLPLAGRTNIILSTREDFTAKNAIIAHSMDELFEILKGYDSDDVFIIGGGKVYKALEPYADTAYITKIDYSYQADTYFPDLDAMDNWEITEEGEEKTCFSMEYYFLTYTNKSPKTI